MAIPLLTTKLFIPPARVGRVQRARLLARLDDVLRPGARLALISAPAGFGKTSLLAEWLEKLNRPAAWVSLDSADNAPGAFLAYLVAALDRAQPGLVRETAALLRADPPAPAEAILAGMVNELAACAEIADPARPFIIVLDDFQFLSAPAAREAAAFLNEHLPPVARLVIATRSDPPLPLARLRARGELVEIRAADLRFTPAETAQFLEQTAGLRLEVDSQSETAGALAARTEGWAAGLQMATIAMQSGTPTNPVEFIRTFSGSHRFVLDYLAEEVLARLPEETVEFLLRTAVLERFNAALCAQVSATNRAADDCQRLLEELERANLFLVPLDAERRWYRYHHLFADLLRARLKQIHPQLIPELHRQAADWFEQNDLAAEAIQHALAAASAVMPGSAAAGQDFGRAARLVEQHTVELFVRGELHGLEHWISLLPDGLADQRPWLCIYRAWVKIFGGRLGEIEPLLQSAEAHQDAQDEADQRLLIGHCAAIRCHRSVLLPRTGDVPSLYSIVEASLPEDAWARGVADWSFGFYLREHSQLEEAGEIFDRLARRDRAQGDPWGAAMAFTDLGIVRRIQGRLRESLDVYRSGLRTVEEFGGRRFGYTGRLLTGLAAVLYERSELAEARALLEEAADLNQRWRNPNHLVFAYLNLSRLFAALGEFSRARELLDFAGQVLRDLPVLATLMHSVAANQMLLELAEGRVPPLGGALEEQIQAALGEDITGQPFNEPREVQRAFLAKILLAQGRPGEALRLLDGLVSAARQNGRGMPLVEFRALQALAWNRLGKKDAALQALEEAVNHAGPEGAIRSIVDTAPLVPGALRELLEALKRRLPAQRAYLEQLTAALPTAPDATGPTTAGEKPALKSPGLALVENLSEREMEVLRLLAEGLTNPQIAARLVITTGTVKAHTAAIFRKLDVANRTQAVSKAREFGLLDHSSPYK